MMKYHVDNNECDLKGLFSPFEVQKMLWKGNHSRDNIHPTSDSGHARRISQSKRSVARHVNKKKLPDFSY